MAMVLDATGLMPSSPSSAFAHNSNVPCCCSFSTFHARRNFSLLPSCSGLRICLPASSISPTRSSTRVSSKITCEQPPMAPTQNVITEAGVVSDKTWQQLVVESEIPVLVDFWAPWCGPCRMIAPLIDELARQYAGRFRCLKLNTDESPNTATEYGIRSIPTVMIFKGGEKKDTVIGAVPKATLISTMEKFLDN